MTTPPFENNPVIRLRSSAALLFVSCMCFVGCGNPPAPKIKEIVAYNSSFTLTSAYSYTDDNELKSVVQSYLTDSTEDQMYYSYDDGQLNKFEYHGNVPKNGSAKASQIVSMKFSYSEEVLTGFKLGFSDEPGVEVKGTMDYNSDDTLAKLSFRSPGDAGGDYDRAEYSFDYTEDSLFEKVSYKSPTRQRSTYFDYNSEDLISEIRARSFRGDMVDHEYGYNSDGQLVSYEDDEADCELTYNDEDLINEVYCTDRRGNYSSYEITYYQDESVKGMIPRIPGIGFGEYFSLDGKSIAPADFAEPRSLFSFLPN